METPINTPNVPVPAVDQPTPWYRSKTQLLQVTQTVLGIGLALGFISPQLGTALSGNIEPIVGGVMGLIGVLSLITHPTEVKNTATEAANQASEATVEVLTNPNDPLNKNPFKVS